MSRVATTLPTTQPGGSPEDALLARIQGIREEFAATTDPLERRRVALKLAQLRREHVMAFPRLRMPRPAIIVPGGQTETPSPAMDDVRSLPLPAETALPGAATPISLEQTVGNAIERSDRFALPGGASPGGAPLALPSAPALPLPLAQRATGAGPPVEPEEEVSLREMVEGRLKKSFKAKRGQQKSLFELFIDRDVTLPRSQMNSVLPILLQDHLKVMSRRRGTNFDELIDIGQMAVKFEQAGQDQELTGFEADTRRINAEAGRDIATTRRLEAELGGAKKATTSIFKASEILKSVGTLTLEDVEQSIDRRGEPLMTSRKFNRKETEALQQIGKLLNPLQGSELMSGAIDRAFTLSVSDEKGATAMRLRRTEERQGKIQELKPKTSLEQALIALDVFGGEGGMMQDRRKLIETLTRMVALMSPEERQVIVQSALGFGIEINVQTGEVRAAQ